ncbi:hypothetical protein, partial [Ralstonia pseudosolanacearum]|uniref:hypothetical protein n=1 Tax=Ralstonia pseudosolanacearum TaxID=1310165 RepID=UPI003CEC276C
SVAARLLQLARVLALHRLAVLMCAVRRAGAALIAIGGIGTIGIGQPPAADARGRTTTGIAALGLGRHRNGAQQANRASHHPSCSNHFCVLLLVLDSTDCRQV